jgi:acetyltransferase-like isoleucine patch superfamily enzyme
MSQLRVYLINRLFQLMPTMRMRTWYLRKLGAQIGSNCRIHAVTFLNAEFGFTRLAIESNCYIGPDVLLDLAGQLHIREGAVISARAVILTHDDPGFSHGSPVCSYYPPTKSTTIIGSHCWIGAGAIVIAGSELGEQSVLGAGSVAKGTLAAHGMYASQLAKLKKPLNVVHSNES